MLSSNAPPAFVMLRFNIVTLLAVLPLLASCSNNAAQETIVRHNAEAKELAEIQLGPVIITVTDANLAVGVTTSMGGSQVQYWVDNQYVCGPKDREGDYFDETFFHAFERERWTSYIVQTPETPIVTLSVVRNAMHYKDVETARQDFYGCDVGVAMPIAVNDQWIVLGLNASEGVDTHTSLLAEAMMESIRFAKEGQ